MANQRQLPRVGSESRPAQWPFPGSAREGRAPRSTDQKTGQWHARAAREGRATRWGCVRILLVCAAPVQAGAAVGEASRGAMLVSRGAMFVSRGAMFVSRRAMLVSSGAMLVSRGALQAIIGRRFPPTRAAKSAYIARLADKNRCQRLKMARAHACGPPIPANRLGKT